ncbi:HpaA family protein [Helicobacter salomonis]|uniref:HpaA family protein n=1 Tax=Helicobacter salomonis TaxID=56878 RepID=UPI000CF0EBE4|nr:HpaA family protein [Helicobacter salomonis]
MYKKIVLCSLLGISAVAQAANKETRHVEGVYTYDLHEDAQPKNHYTLALAPLALNFSENVPSVLRDKFKTSLQKQLTEMLEKRGFSVIRASLSDLNATQKADVFAVVNVGAFVNILEDTDMKLSGNNQGIEEDVTDLSAGFLRLKLIEPKSGSAFHMASIELPDFKVKAHVRVSRQRTSSGGFMPISQTTVIRGEKFEENVNRVLSKVYAKSMQKLSQDLIPQNFKPYEHLVENFKRAQAH